MGQSRVGLHSLSPTMLSGTLYSSVVEVGLAISAGEDDKEATNQAIVDFLIAFLLHHYT